MDVLIDAADGRSYGSTSVADKLKSYENAIIEKLVEVETRLTELEAK
jgi:hypothetical protein